MFNDIMLNEDIEFYMFVNNNGFIEVKKVIIDINKFNTIKSEIYKFHNRSNIINEITTIEEIESKYDDSLTKICVLSQEYNNHGEGENVLYDFKYYTHNIDGEKILNILDKILENQDDILMETYYIKQLIDWPFGNNPKDLMEKHLINCLLNSFNIISVENNETNNLLHKLNSFVSSYNSYKFSINQIVNDNTDNSIEYLQHVISSSFNIHFKFPKIVKSFVKPIAEGAYKRKIKKLYIPRQNRIDTIYNKH